MVTVQSTPLVDTYRAKTPGSFRLAAEAAEVFPGGVTHDSRLLDPYPVFCQRASGPTKWDVDGNRYVDYSGGHGALLLGHNHLQVTAAVSKQLESGTHYGACHELELRWGRLVQQLVPTAERVRFTSSGTEATLLALRLARAHTGKRRVMRFAGHFHGWHDHMAFGVQSHFDGTPTPGVLPELAHQIVLAPPDDWPAVQQLLADDDLAAVIVEPTGASWGQVPLPEGFLELLRAETRRLGIVLIFDEVISGFRCSPGGAQQVLGIDPDLTTLAKILAGGLPGGAVAGRRSIMDALDPAACAAAGKDKIPHQGTFNANPLSAAAGIATLSIVAGTDSCGRASDYAARLREELRRVLRDEQVPWVVYGTYSGFHIFTNPDRIELTAEAIEAGKCGPQVLKRASKRLATRLRVAMLVNGVDLFGWPGGPTSAVHGDDELRQTTQAFRASLRALRDESVS